MSKLSAVLLVCAVLVMPSLAIAQHHHHHKTYHHGSNWGHSNWSYVIPSHSHYGNQHHGSYYVTGKNYYYTPSSVTYSTSMNVAPAPPRDPVQLQFGGFSRCEDLSGRLESEVNNFCLDLHYNYQHNPGFGESYREA